MTRALWGARMCQRLVSAQALWILLLLFLSWPDPALGASGAPEPWQMGLQTPFSPVAERIQDFHTMMLWIIGAICAFVLALLVFVVFRFNRCRNPVPAGFSHNVKLEILWTMLPVLILLVIAIPSFRLLYYGDRTMEPEMSLIVTGYQWYWGYEYPDHGDISFMSYMVPTEDLEPDQKRLLSTDAPVVLPVDTTIQILVTAGDVIHAFAVPALGLKIDAVPGRMNETWVRIRKPGIYYGQCSELCGRDHAYMPIEIHAVSKTDFAQWVVEQGGTMPDPTEPDFSQNE